jgi:sugar-specific transcriptional regulator TrmB
MENLLKGFGASEKESEIFMKLLELGAQPISVIAKYSGVPRPSMYVILERLKKLGLIEELERNGIKYVKCIAVNDLDDLIKLKEKKINYLSKMLSAQKPELLSLENRLSSTPRVKFYQGKLEVMKMYEELLKTGPFCALFNPKLVKKLMPEYHYKIGEIIKQKKWSIRELVVNCEEAFEYDKLFSSKLHKVKILPPSWYFECDIIIKDEITYMVSYGEVDLTGSKIINDSIAKTQQVLFEYVWSQMK